MDPSPWVTRWTPHFPPGRILDLACGTGRHSLYLAELGHDVLAVDRLPPPTHPRITGLQWDLETGDLGPLQEQRFAGIVVTNYLHRPLFPWLGRALETGGLLLYETFMPGGHVSNPAFLLQPGELETAFPYQTLAYEETEGKQRYAGTRSSSEA